MAQPKLNQRALNSIKIPFPSIEEQRVVVSKLDELADGNGQLSEVYEKKLIALTELKQSLLQKAFSGELAADRAGHEIGCVRVVKDSLTSAAYRARAAP